MGSAKDAAEEIKISVKADTEGIAPSAKANWAEFKAAMAAAVAKVARDFGHEAEVDQGDQAP